MRELTAFQKEYFQKLREEELAELAKHTEIIEAFKTFCEPFGILLTDENFRYFHTSGILATYPNLSFTINPVLHLDKEGLLDFGKLSNEFPRMRFMNGMLDAKNHMLMAHYHFRRSFSQVNNFAPSFIDLFWQLQDGETQNYISIDPDSVRINMGGYGIMERDMWFGAKFENSIENIQNGIVKLRPPLDVDDGIISFFFASAYSLDIKWSTKDSIKSVQMEEFKTEEVVLEKDGIEYHPVRYVHAEYDFRAKSFRHFDGAIHFYTSEEYFQRRESDFNFNSKNSSHIKTLSQKLFKLNGVVPVSQWVELTSHFLTKNPLIIEYFDGVYPDYILEMLKKVRTAI